MRRPSAQALYSNRGARALHNLPSRRRSSRFGHEAFVIVIVALFVLCSIGLVICWSFVFPDAATRVSRSKWEPRVSRIAFGSSSSHDYSAQPVWVHGIIPSDPHAWIWLGNMAYLDEARVNCDASPNHYQCNCSADWLRQPPYFCMTGDLQHAASKMQIQLANPDYAQFLAFMCPGHREKGLFPPPGADPAVCPRSIFGTYNDHDYGWRHGNKRLPHKDALKQVFLDAIGESLDSRRRSKGRGIEWKYTLNQGNKGYEVDVILLDTRYYRDPLPCHTRRSFCNEVTRATTSLEHRAWCEDHRKGETDMGSCCDKDDLFLNESKLPQSLSNYSFCDVLGNDQREWLDNTLLQSNSPLKLIVSSSFVLPADEQAPCSLDNWDCYKTAQLNLLELVTKASGCVIILSAGIEHSRIQVLRSGSQARYGRLIFSRDLYEVTLSGLTNTTDTCDGADCGPSFGMVEIDNGIVKLQIRDGMSGHVKRESAFSLATCLAAKASG